MKYLNFESKYNRFPKIPVTGFDTAITEGYRKIADQLLSAAQGKKIITIETYYGVDLDKLEAELFPHLDASLIIHADSALMDAKEIRHLLQRNVTDDRVFGVMSHHMLEEFFIEEKVEALRNQIDSAEGRVIVYGTGASLIHTGDILVYGDMARWEIQQRFRAGMANWQDDNHDEDMLRKYKKSYFIEWRMCDRLKRKLYNQMDFILDTNKVDTPKMVPAEAYLAGISQAANKPFRLVPYFDPGVWGGQWMKEVCNLDPEKENYAWSFDGVPEENSIYLEFGDNYIEIPSINVVFREPVNLLGDTVHARFGTEFPIRFDFLDTMEGGHLSLQVHPLTEYIQDKFGMAYTQDESYYILDAGDDACVYLGTKEGIDPDEMFRDLERAQAGEITFPDEKYINKFPAKKHDHFLIPAGTIHCSGRNSMVLEVSATPYIFTFKLWDWGRVGMDGIPRPVHLEHGRQVVQFDRDTKWVEKNLVNDITLIEETPKYKEEKTGLHQREPIETRRFTFNDEVILDNKGSVNMLNLIQGQEVVVESLDSRFEPLTINFAETFIVPASCKRYKVRVTSNETGEDTMIIQAYVRS